MIVVVRAQSRVVYIAPAVHLLFCFLGFIGTLVPQLSILAFAWTIVFIVDFPISIVPSILIWKYQTLAGMWLIVVGTLWWYLISRGVQRLAKQIHGE